MQIPEEIGTELVDLAPHSKDWEVMQEAFLQSLIWREPTKCTEATHDYLNVVFRSRYEQVYSTLLMLASDPDHPYNAKSLHSHLEGLTMANRDSLWSIFLHRHYGDEGSMDRLLTWAWHAEKDHICDESIKLSAMALLWYTTTSHRFVRDRATKALVAMLSRRPHVMVKLISEFAGVNDLYVLERLYATAYGVSMLSTEDTAVAELAKCVYQHVFENGSPIPHILLRDYARGAVEVALQRAAIPPEIDMNLVRPPYSSEWPLDVPEEQEIAHYGDWQQDADDGMIARNMIYGSVMGRIEGDFSHYVIGRTSRWSSQRIDEKLGQNQRTANEFFRSLTKQQKKAWDTLDVVRKKIPQLLSLDPEARTKHLPISDEQLRGLPKAAEDAFIQALGKKKSAIYTKYVIPYLAEKMSGEFDMQMARRWILNRVFDLGWTEDRFGYFDRWLNYSFRYGRSGHKPERIGKKYQWIAYHEFFAHVADHFFLREEYGSSTTELYDNPDQVSMRDIDPSLLLDTSDSLSSDNGASDNWWHGPQYAFSEATSEEKRLWTLDTDDTPSPHSMIEMVNPSDGSSWLALYSNNTWSDTDLTESTIGSPRREMWFHIRCYLVRRAHSDAVFERFQNTKLWGKHLHELGQFSGVFLGEYPWASICNKPEVHPYWTTEIDYGSEPLPYPVSITAMQYEGMSEYDCSGKEGSSGILPSAALCDCASLQWSKAGFSFTDRSGQTAVYDPSVRSDGGRVLLMSKDFYLAFIGKSDCDLIWTVLGAREYHVAHSSAYDAVISVSGAYRLEGGRLVGAMNEFVSSYAHTDNTTREWQGRAIHVLT